MIEDKKQNWLYTIVLLGMTAVISLNLFPKTVLFFIGIFGIIFIINRAGFPILLASMSLLGLIFINLYKEFSATVVLTFLLGLTVNYLFFRRQNQKLYLNKYLLNRFVIWVLLLYFVVILQYFAGPHSYYNDYSIQYFLVYASYYIVSGLLIVKFRIHIFDLTLPGLFFFSFAYPSMDISVFRAPSLLAYSEMGMRAIEGADCHGIARIGGLLLIQLLLKAFHSKDVLKVFYEFLLGVAIIIPYVWFSYTRQVFLAILIVLFVIALVTIYNKNYSRKIGMKIRVVMFLFLIVFVGLKTIESVTSKYHQSRFATAGFIDLRDDSSINRIHLWRFSWEMIKKEPIYGYGLGGFGEAFSGSAWAWPHNWFVEAWVNLGILGLLIILYGAAVLVKPLFRQTNSWLLHWAILGFYYLILLQFTADIPRNSIIFMFIAITAVTGMQIRGKNSPRIAGQQIVHRKAVDF